MAFDIDMTMLLYLAIITAGIFIFPIQSDPPYYLVIGLALIGVGGALVFHKSRKKS